MSETNYGQFPSGEDPGKRIDSYFAIYDQLSGQPRYDFFNMPHGLNIDEEIRFREYMVAQDHEAALKTNAQYSADAIEEHVEFNTPEDQQLFGRLSNGDRTAIKEVYEKFWDHAHIIGSNYAKKFSGSGIEEDLYQAAFLGIGDAAESIMEGRTTMDHLNAIVRFRVNGSVIDALRSNNSFGSAAYGASLFEIKKAKRIFEAKHQRSPGAEEISAELGWSRRDVSTILLGENVYELEQRSRILEHPSAEDLVANNMLFSSEREDTALTVLSTEELVLEATEKTFIADSSQKLAIQALLKLPEFERDIFERFYGMGDYFDAPQSSIQIAKDLGETSDNVRQILCRSRQRLQKVLVSPF